MADLCGRCLIVLDVRSNVAAYGSDWQESCDTPTNPRSVANWVERMGIKGADRFSVNSMDWAFEPVNTWHGDPVCAGHLWELRERELRRG